MASVTFDDDPDQPPTAAAASGVPTPAGIPRIAVTPAARGPVTFDDNPGQPPPSKAVETGKQQSAMGWPEWTGQGVHDFFSAVNRYGSVGLSPRIYAGIEALSGQQPDYDTALKGQLERYGRQSERSPIATTAGTTVGGAGAGMGMTAGLAAGAPAVTGAALAARMGAGPVARFLGFGAEAGAQGAIQGAGQTYTGEVEDYLRAAKEGFGTGALIGGTLGTLVPRSAVQQRAGDPRTGQPIRPPSEEQLERIVDRGYELFRQLPATYANRGFQAHLTAAERDMTRASATAATAAPVYHVLDQLRSGAYGFANAAGDIGPVQIELARRALNNMKNSATDASAMQAGTAARILRGALEDFVQNPGANVTGNAKAAADAARLIENVRPNAAALFRSRQLTDPLADATLKAARGGPAVGEQLGAKADRILATKGGQQPRTRGWVDEERARLAAAVTPTATERVASGFANLPLKTIGAGIGGTLGGGGGVMTGNIPGAIGAGTIGAGLGAATGAGLQSAARGFSARGIANRWDAAAEAMRGRSPAYERALQGAVPVPGPGMGLVGQGVVGAGTAELGTPYDDGRAALVPSVMQQFGLY